MTAAAPRMSLQESRAWLGLISLTQTLPLALDKQLLEDSHLTHFEFTVLASFYSNADPAIRMSRLAELTASTLPRLSHVVTRMEGRELLERTGCPEDRRATNVRLTPLGRRTFVRALPQHLNLVRSLVLDALTPAQLESLGEISEAIDAKLSDHRGLSITPPSPSEGPLSSPNS